MSRQVAIDREVIRRITDCTRQVCTAEVARQVHRTRPSWFDGLDPATAWALVWIASNAPNPRLEPLVETATRCGYRHGRIVLGVEAHPSFSHPQVLDIAAEGLLDLAGQLVASRALDQLPTEVHLSRRQLARDIAELYCDLVRRGVGAARPAVEATLTLGLAVALVEHHLVSCRPIVRNPPS